MRAKEELPECPVATAVSLIGGKWKLLILPILIPSNQKLQINYGGYYGKLHKNNYWKGKSN